MAAVSDDPLRMAGVRIHISTVGADGNNTTVCALRRERPRSVMDECIHRREGEEAGGFSLARTHVAQSSPSVSAIAFRDHAGYN